MSAHGGESSAIGQITDTTTAGPRLRSVGTPSPAISRRGESRPDAVTPSGKGDGRPQLVGDLVATIGRVSEWTHDDSHVVVLAGLGHPEGERDLREERRGGRVRIGRHIELQAVSAFAMARAGPEALHPAVCIGPHGGDRLPRSIWASLGKRYRHVLAAHAAPKIQDVRGDFRRRDGDRLSCKNGGG